MMFVVIAGALAVLTFLAYFLGVRRGRSWARVVVAVCALGLVGVVVFRFAGRGAKPNPGFRDDYQRMAARAETLGRALKPHLKPGSRIFIFGDVPVEWETVLPGAQKAWKEGLSKGLGDSTWVQAGYGSPPRGEFRLTESALSEGLGQADGQVDAVVSFAGLPENLEETALYKGETGRPRVAVLFVDATDAEVALVGKWLKAGLVDGAAVERNGKLQLSDRTAMP